MFLMRTTALSLVACLTLVSCGGDILPPLPSGEQTVSGTLKPAELSATRRGSHLIEQEGVDVYYAESSLINLRQYQGKRVTVRGVLEHNTDPEGIPVLVVESVVDVEETVSSYEFPTLHLSLEAPVHWKLEKLSGKYQFALEEEEEALLTIQAELGQQLPDGGTPIVIDAARATRLVDEGTNSQIVTVLHNEKVITFHFTPALRTNADRLTEDFVLLLKSVDLTEPKRDDDPVTATGALGIPCGGPAGILCPTGEYCDVTDLSDGVGRCRKI